MAKDSTQNPLSTGVVSISPRELKQKLDSGESLILLDVREPHERAFCSISAPAPILDLHIPMGAVPSRLDDFQNRDEMLVIYCHHGVRSMVVAEWLAKRVQRSIGNLDGGIDAWSRQVDPQVPRY